MKKTNKSIILMGILVSALSVGMIGTASAVPTYNPLHNLVDVVTSGGHDYNTDEYDDNGYDRHGYNVHGYNRHGYNNLGHYNRHYNLSH